MTVSTAARKSTFNGNDLARTHACLLRPKLATQVLATFLPAVGASSTLVLNTDYSFNLQTYEVVYPLDPMLPPLATGDKIVFTYNMNFLQLIEISNEGFYPANVEQGLDTSRLTDLQLLELLDRAVKVPVGSDTNPDDLIAELVQAAADAETAAVLAESWAIDPIGDRPEGSAKYWAEQAELQNDEAESWAIGLIGDRPEGSSKYWAEQAELLAGNFYVDTFIGDGTANPLTLTYPAAQTNTFMSIDHANQHQNNFVVVGNQLTPQGIIPLGAEVEVRYGRANIQTINVPANGSVVAASMTADAIYTAAIQNDAVTYAKMQNVSAASRILLRGSLNGAGDVEEGTLNPSLVMTGTVISQSVGSVIQSVTAEYNTWAALTGTATPQTDTLPLITQGTQILSVTITPKNASSLLRLTFIGTGTNTVTTTTVAALFRDATANAIAVGAGRGTDANNPGAIGLQKTVTAGSTASTTFTLRICTASGTVYMNGNSGGRLWGGASVCTLTVEEIQA